MIPIKSSELVKGHKKFYFTGLIIPVVEYELSPKFQ